MHFGEWLCGGGQKEIFEPYIVKCWILNDVDVKIGALLVSIFSLQINLKKELL